MFFKYDADHNGSIDVDEARPILIDNLKKHRATKLKITDDELNDWFSKADLNNDGVISYEEAALFVDKYFLINDSQTESIIDNTYQEDNHSS